MGSSQEPRVFRPSRWKFWAPVFAGLLIVLVAVPFLLVPILVAKSQRGWAMLVVGIAGVTMLLLGLWLFRHAFGLWGAVVRIADDCLELKVQQWALWKHKRLRSARLSWNEIHKVRLCTIDNILVPGGLDENFILSTTQGEFVVQTKLWGAQARQVAELVADRIQQPIQLPTDDASAARQLSPAEHRGVKLMRAFGWVCTVLACLFMGLLLITLPTATPDERWEIGKAFFCFGFILFAARSLRRFKVRMG
jgi:hypothetical protein